MVTKITPRFKQEKPHVFQKYTWLTSRAQETEENIKMLSLARLPIARTLSHLGNSNNRSITDLSHIQRRRCHLADRSKLNYLTQIELPINTFLRLPRQLVFIVFITEIQHAYRYKYCFCRKNSHQGPRDRISYKYLSLCVFLLTFPLFAAKESLQRFPKWSI